MLPSSCTRHVMFFCKLNISWEILSTDGRHPWTRIPGTRSRDGVGGAPRSATPPHGEHASMTKACSSSATERTLPVCDQNGTTGKKQSEWSAAKKSRGHVILALLPVRDVGSDIGRYCVLRVRFNFNYRYLGCKE
jgi:hypothetical protein